MADDQKPAAGFVPLKSVKGGAPEPAAALAEIRQIYFKTSRQTIDHDFAHAIELLKGLPDEAMRERAHVYMEGLAEMQREWAQAPRAGRGKSGKPKGGKPNEPKGKAGRPPTKRSGPDRDR